MMEGAGTTGPPVPGQLVTVPGHAVRLLRRHEKADPELRGAPSSVHMRRWKIFRR